MEGWTLDAKQEASDEVEDRPVKCVAVSGADPKVELLLKICVILSKLGLKSALDIRELQAATMVNVLCNAAREYVVTGRAKNKNTAYIKRCADPKRNPVNQRPVGPLHVHVWSGLLTAALKDLNTTPEIQARLQYIKLNLVIQMLVLVWHTLVR